MRMTVVDRQGYNIYIYTTTPNHSILSGNAHLDQKNYDQAIADYTNAIRLSPNNASGYRGRGRAYNAQKNYDMAIADYAQAIRLDPNNASGYYNRGNAHYVQKNYDQAIADYEAALRIDPNHTNAREWLGKVRQARGR
jgi:tetratricopeptide (TPR) repeat protein